MNIEQQVDSKNRSYSSLVVALIGSGLAGCTGLDTGATRSVTEVGAGIGQVEAAVLTLPTHFASVTTWTPEYSDAGVWDSNPAYWQTIQFPDVNGDGRADVCGRDSVGIVCAVSQLAGTSFGSAGLWRIAYGDSDGWANAPYFWQTIRFPDLNADGRDDVCGRSGDGLYCALSNGSSFDAPSLWISPPRDGYGNAGGWADNPAYWQTIQFPDLNNDGRADVCGRHSLGMYCAISQGTRFLAPSFWTTSYANSDDWANSPSFWQTIQFPDLNGDGRADICGRRFGGLYCAISTGGAFGLARLWSTDYSNPGGWADLPAYWQTIQFPDLNGDGKADVCGRHSQGLLCALSDGFNFGPTGFWTSTYNNGGGWSALPAYWQTIQFPDINGDGNADVCGRGVAGLHCGVSSGFSFSTPTLWTTGYRDADSWATSPSYWQTIRFPDLDGDGAADVCGRWTTGVQCALARP